MDSEQVRYLFYHELTHITTTFCVPGCRGISLYGYFRIEADLR